jgi:GTPase
LHPILYYVVSWAAVNFVDVGATVQDDGLVLSAVEEDNRETLLKVTSIVHLDKKAVGKHIDKDLLVVVAADGVEGIRTENLAVAAAVILDSTCLVVDREDTVAVAVVHY